MNNPIRPDVAANRLLDKQYDLDSMSFEDARWLFHDFIEDVLISRNRLSDLGVSSEIILHTKYYVGELKRYLRGQISSVEINNIGISSRAVYLKTSGNDRNAIDFVITGLSDRERALFDEYGPSMHIGTLVSMTYQLGGEALCNEFVDYLHRYPAMKKYRRADQDFPDG